MKSDIKVDISGEMKGKEQITTYPSMVWLKFKLSTYGLKFDTLPT